MNINTHIDGRQSFDVMGREIDAKAHKTQRIYDHKKRASMTYSVGHSRLESTIIYLVIYIFNRYIVL